MLQSFFYVEYSQVTYWNKGVMNDAHANVSFKCSNILNQVQNRYFYQVFYKVGNQTLLRNSIFKL